MSGLPPKSEPMRAQREPGGLMLMPSLSNPIVYHSHLAGCMLYNNSQMVWSQLCGFLDFANLQLGRVLLQHWFVVILSKVRVSMCGFNSRLDRLLIWWPDHEKSKENYKIQKIVMRDGAYSLPSKTALRRPCPLRAWGSSRRRDAHRWSWLHRRHCYR